MVKSGSLLPSPVLWAMGVADDVLHSAMRFSLSPLLSEAEIDLAAERIIGVVKGFTRWLAGRRRDGTMFYLLLVLVGVGLSIGPPFGLWPFVYWLPGFNFIRAPSRFMLLAVLGLSVLAGAGFDRVSMRLAASTRLAVAAIVAALIVAEFAVLELAVTADRPQVEGGQGDDAQ